MMVENHNEKNEGIFHDEVEKKDSIEDKTTILLLAKLPRYVVNCFITAGYDTIDVIKDINDKTINDIEEFINDNFPKNQKYIHPDFDICKIPPGHRMRITKFVQEISCKNTSKKRLRSTFIESKTSKKTKYLSISESLESSTSDDTEIKLSLKECLNKVRNLIVNWQRKATEKHIQQLVEHKDYEIHVNQSIDIDKGPSVSIMCKKCNKKSVLGLKGQTTLLCNWKQHISTCITKDPTQAVLKGTKLHNFFKLSCSSQAGKRNFNSEPKSIVHIDTNRHNESHFENKKVCDINENTDNSVVSQNSTSISVHPNCDSLPTSNDKRIENFQKAPSAKPSPEPYPVKTNEMSDAEGANVDIHVDWSRKSRNALKMMEISENPGQTKITDYFEIIEKIDVLLNEKCSFAEQSLLKFNVADTTGSKNFGSFFKQLLHNAEKNCLKLPKQRRHDSLTKQFATALYVYSGQIAYNFVYKNIPECIPSLRTVQRIVHNDYTFQMEGIFQFKGLEEHLSLYNASKIVSISEDTTQLIARVDYDKESDKLVGFVLPCNNEGVPLTDSFIATSFEFVEQSFMSTEIGKYVLVHMYMAQPLEEHVPAFCLMCTATNNKYNAEFIVKRWKYIYDECSTRGIRIISFGADGDSKQLRSMKLSTQLFKKSVSLQTTSAPLIKIPEKWKSWFLLYNPTTVAHVQDTIHLAVKLKARLLKTSIILPLGKYVAGLHHLRIIQQTFGKDQHGLREKDLNPIDRQNFDAVTRITSTSTLNVLETMLDAKGTQMFLEVIQCVVNSYLSKTAEPLNCIKNAWYAVYFCRYWRYWLLHNPNYTLKNNFITSNAYYCIELNAHSLITFLITLRDCDLHYAEKFFPWLLGSQQCEKAFRAMRSMSTFYSTIINFSMLGFLRKLHRMHIQLKLEGEMKQNGIFFPHLSKHDHSSDTKCNHNVSRISDEAILEAVKTAELEARDAMEKLGMADALKCNGEWINPSHKSSDELEDESSDDSDVENTNETDDTSKNENQESVLLKETLSVDDNTLISADINLLSTEGVISDKLTSHIKDLQNACDVVDTCANNWSTNIKEVEMEFKKPHDQFFDVIIKGKSFKLHKVTAVWLLQEGEKVSSDRLFRVRSKQPTANLNLKSENKIVSTIPYISEILYIGDFCAFTHHDLPLNQVWKIGKVLQFSRYKEKLKGKQQYYGKHVVVKENVDKIGVLCTWYDIEENINSNSTDKKNTEFHIQSISSTNKVHYYHPLSHYICTIPAKCFKIENDGVQFESVLKVDQSDATVNSTSTLIISKDTVTRIDNLVSEKDTTKVAVLECKQLRTKKIGLKLAVTY